MSASITDATLERLEATPQGTWGRFLAGPLRLFSCELPWRDNQPSVSCVPAGTYRCVFTYSPRFRRYLYLVGPVPGRSGIRVHPANFPRQLNGCVALGERLGWIAGEKAVLLSAPAVRRVEEYFGGKPFLLEVLDA